MNVPTSGGDAWEVFNRRFDVLFGENTCDASGCLKNIRRGALGMDLVLKYLQSTASNDGILWAAVRPKIERLASEVKKLL